MANELTNIITKVKEKLDAQVGSGKPLADAKIGHVTHFSGYPAATFEPSDQEGDFQTTSENERRYDLIIAIHQEMQAVKRDEAVQILAAAQDTLVNDFESDWTLGGVVHYCKALPIPWAVYVEDAGEVLVAQIKLSCVKSVQI